MGMDNDGWFRTELDDVENRRAERALGELMAEPPTDDGEGLRAPVRTAEENDVSTDGHRKFKFGLYGKAELFRAACKRRGIKAKQDLEVVYVPEDDADHVRQLARRYGLQSIDGVPGQ